MYGVEPKKLKVAKELMKRFPKIKSIKTYRGSSALCFFVLFFSKKTDMEELYYKIEYYVQDCVKKDNRDGVYFLTIHDLSMTAFLDKYHKLNVGIEETKQAVRKGQ